MGKIFRGGALAAEGSLAQGVADIREGIAGVRSKGTEYTVPTFLAWMAALCLAGGQVEQGMAAVEEGLAMSAKNADRFSLPEFHRLKGEFLLAGPRRDESAAEACFREAIGIARAARQDVRVARDHEPGTSLGGAQPARRSWRSAGPHLRVVH
jgi:predicted ATPase